MDTFLIRVWRRPEGAAQEGLRGTVQRIGAGETHTFRDERELVAYLRAEPTAPEGRSTSVRSAEHARSRA